MKVWVENGNQHYFTFLSRARDKQIFMAYNHTKPSIGLAVLPFSVSRTRRRDRKLAEKTVTEDSSPLRSRPPSQEICRWLVVGKGTARLTDQIPL